MQYNQGTNEEVDAVTNVTCVSFVNKEEDIPRSRSPLIGGNLEGDNPIDAGRDETKNKDNVEKKTGSVSSDVDELASEAVEMKDALQVVLPTTAESKELVDSLQSFSPHSSPNLLVSGSNVVKEEVTHAVATSASSQSHFGKGSEGTCEEKPRESRQKSAATPHRVFTTDELKAYMERQRQRQRERNKHEEMRHVWSKRNSFPDDSIKSRASASGMSSVRLSTDVPSSRPSPLLQGAQPSFLAATPHNFAYAGGRPPLQPAVPDAPPPPPPYPHNFAAGGPLPLSGGMRAPPHQQLPPAVCAPWGFPTPLPSSYLGLPYPYGLSPTFGSSAPMQIEQQTQRLNSFGAQFMAPPPLPGQAAGSTVGMSMEELKVLAQLIVHARGEQQQQQQFFFQQKPMMHSQPYCYYQGGEPQNIPPPVSAFASGATSAPVGRNTQEDASASNVVRNPEKDPKIISTPERQHTQP